MPMVQDMHISKRSLVMKLASLCNSAKKHFYQKELRKMLPGN